MSQEDIKPFKSPEITQTSNQKKKSYPGIHRFEFILLVFAIFILFTFQHDQFISIKNDPETMVQNTKTTILIISLSTLLFFGIIILRLKNIGYHWTYAFLAFVPIANLIVISRCLICRPGYVEEVKTGIGRSVFNLVFIGTSIISAIIYVWYLLPEKEPAELTKNSENSFLFISIYLSILFVIVAQRLKNIGYGWGYSVLLIVPIIDLLLILRCIVCQTNYAESKKLDRAGRIISVVISLLIACGMLYFFLFVLRYS